MAGEREPLEALTSDNNGVLVSIVSFSFVSVLVIITIVRFGHAIARKHPFRYDDATYISASVCSLPRLQRHVNTYRLHIGSSLSHLRSLAFGRQFWVGKTHLQSQHA